MKLPLFKDEIRADEKFLVAALCNGHSCQDAAQALRKPEGYCASIVRELKARYSINNREQLGVWACRVGIV